MNVRKLLALTMTILLLVMLFAGCGAQSTEAAKDSMDYFADNGSAMGGATAPEMDPNGHIRTNYYQRRWYNIPSYHQFRF